MTIGHDPAAAFGAIRQVAAGVLDVGYAEVGPPEGPVAVLLHGWPYDIHAFTEVAPRLAEAGYRVLIPWARGFGSTRFLDEDAVRTGEQAALAVDVIDFMDAMGVSQAVVAGFDWGARTATSRL